MRLLASFVLALPLLAQVNWQFAFPRNRQTTAATMVRGYTFLVQVEPQWGLTFHCYATSGPTPNACHDESSPTPYRPNGTEHFLMNDVGDGTNPVPGGLRSDWYISNNVPYGSNAVAHLQNAGDGHPHYVPINVETNGNTTGWFNLARYNAYFNVVMGGANGTMMTPGTITQPTGVTCADGTWPGPPNGFNTGNNLGTGAHPASGSVMGLQLDPPAGFTTSQSGFVQALFSVTLTGGVISSPVRITGGGPYTTAPTHAILYCSPSANDNTQAQKYDVTLGGDGVIGNGIEPITSDGVAFMYLFSGGYGACGNASGGIQSIYCVPALRPNMVSVGGLPGSQGEGWPGQPGVTPAAIHGGVTKVVWWGTGTNPMLARRASVPTDTSPFKLWSLGYLDAAAEVSIPADAALGTYNAGFRFCPDSTLLYPPAWNPANPWPIPCVDMLWQISIIDVPQFTLQAPTNPPALNASTAPYIMSLPGSGTTPCMNAVGTGGPPPSGLPSGGPPAPYTGTDCSMTALMTSSAEHSYPYLIPTRNGNPAAQNTPDWSFENAATPIFMAYGSISSSSASAVSLWFYDGTKATHRIAEFTGDKSFDNMARAIAARYSGMGPRPYGQKGCPNYWPYSAGGNAGAASGNANNCSPGAPLSMGNMWASQPRGMGEMLSVFNNGNYSDDPMLPHSYSAQMDSELNIMWHWGGVAPNEGDASTGYGVNCNNGTNSPWGGVGSGVTQFYDTRCGIAGPGVGLQHTNGFRGISYPTDVVMEYWKRINPARFQSGSNCGSDPQPCLTRFGWSYKVAIESLRTSVLEIINPAVTSSTGQALGGVAARYNSGPYYEQVYMTQLASEALIMDWEQTQDPLDVYLVKIILDSNYPLYDSTARTMPYCNIPNPATTGAHDYWCAGNANVDINTGWYGYQGAHPQAVGYSFLNAYSAPAAAWYWSHFAGSDNTYALWADQLAQDSLIADYHTAAKAGGKYINEEMFRHMFDYFRWRQQRR